MWRLPMSLFASWVAGERVERRRSSGGHFVNQQTTELSNKMDQKIKLEPLLKLPKYTLQQYECEYEAQQHRVICQPIIRSFVKISLSDAVRLGIPTQPGRKEMMVELP
jgi:hypothetical protein